MRHRPQYFFAVLTGHFHKRKLVKHINRTHQITGNSAFPGNRSQDISRLDMLFLANIDKQTHHAVLRSGIAKLKILHSGFLALLFTITLDIL